MYVAFIYISVHYLIEISQGLKQKHIALGPSALQYMYKAARMFKNEWSPLEFCDKMVTALKDDCYPQSKGHNPQQSVACH